MTQFDRLFEYDSSIFARSLIIARSTEQTLMIDNIKTISVHQIIINGLLQILSENRKFVWCFFGKINEISTISCYGTIHQNSRFFRLFHSNELKEIKLKIPFRLIHIARW